MSNTAKGRTYTAAAALLWGLAGVCVKSISWGSMSIMAFRSLVSLLMLFALRRSCRVNFTRGNVFGGLAMALTGVLYMQAIKQTTAGTAIVLQYIAPILVFLFAVIFQHRRAKLYEAILTALVFSGIVLCFADSLDPTKVLGNMLGLASGVTFAAQIIIMADDSADSDGVVMVGCIISIVLFTPFMFFDRGLSLTAANIFWVMVLSIFQYGLANICFARGIKYIDKVESSLILTLEPIFNPIPVAIVCGEMMGPKAIIGSVIVIAAIALYGIMPSLENRKNA